MIPSQNQYLIDTPLTNNQMFFVTCFLSICFTAYTKMKKKIVHSVTGLAQIGNQGVLSPGGVHALLCDIPSVC